MDPPHLPEVQLRISHSVNTSKLTVERRGPTIGSHVQDEPSGSHGILIGFPSRIISYACSSPRISPSRSPMAKTSIRRREWHLFGWP